MKILFVGRKFGEVAGGVERIAIMLMNAMHQRGHEVGLLTWDQAGAVTHYSMDPSIEWRQLDMGNPMRKAGWGLRLRRMGRIRVVVRDLAPDLIIAFQHGPFLTMGLAVAGLGIPLIAAERNAPNRFDHLRAGRYQRLVFLSFLLADRVTVQLDGYRDCYPGYLDGRIVAIPNPVWPADALVEPGGKKDEPKVLLFVGRLSYQKNPAALIRAFAKLADVYPEWRLDLVGEGEDRKRLEELAGLLGVADRIRFLGVTVDMEREYQRAHLFCLPSRWEGFPNALAEAFAHGVPAVGYEACAGVNTLIRSGRNGLLAFGNGDVDALAEALGALMGSPERRCAFGRAAVDSVHEYAPERIFDQWEELFLDVSAVAKA